MAKKSKRSIKPPTKEFLIGRYQLGWRMVSLYAMPDKLGAWFNLCAGHREAEIHCGMDYRDPAEAFGCLCHEVWEMIMDDMECAYRPKAFMENASDIYRFIFDHNQHTEISARAAFFIWHCMADYKQAFEKCNPRKK